jgi:hypothetical protein
MTALYSGYFQLKIDLVFSYWHAKAARWGIELNIVEFERAASPYTIGAPIWLGF